jgi:putative ABC transport system permease protein
LDRKWDLIILPFKNQDMLKNYFKIGWRTLIDNKLYTTLNVAGFTFGLTCFFLIGLFLYDELTFDQQHTKSARIYRVIEHRTTNGAATNIAAVGFKLAEESKSKVAEVENTTRLQRIGRANLVNPENPVPFHETVTIADENILKIFDFPLLQGDRATALREPNSIIINEELAKRLFGTTGNVMGKTLEFQFGGASPFKITGLLKNHPKNSSFDFNSIVSESSFYGSDNYKNLMLNDWMSNNFSVYVLLKPGQEPATAGARMTKLVKDNFEAPAGIQFSFSLQPLKSMHFRSENILDGARNTNVEGIAKANFLYIKIFSFVALFVLLIAGINYTNLTTARAASRLKEIGVRKTIGAVRKNIFWQFLVESMIVTFISLVLSIILVNLLLPAFNTYTGKELSLGISTDYRIWLLAISFAILTGLISGSYPAVMLSRFRPVLLLKGLKLQSKTNLSLRKSLVVFQFVISVVMIIGTIVVFQQVRYLNHTDLGFDKDLLLVIDVNTGKARSNFEAVKAEMSKIPAVSGVSVTSRVPGEWKTFRTVKVRQSGQTSEPRETYMFGADKDFMGTFGIKLLRGRNFNAVSDSNSIMINETAARMLGITEPSEQLVEFKAVSRGDGSYSEEEDPWKPRVIGIVSDFHFQSLREKVEPLILAYNQNPIHNIDYYSVRIAGSGIESTLGKLKSIMVTNDKNDPFEYHFLDDQLALFYVEDERRQTLLIWVALATIFIACLGLFGLATYAAQQRIKEIGVRKVLGASVVGLASLLSRDFLKLVLIANCIAFPIAWWVCNKWLQEYAYHIEIKWWIFIVAGICAMLIALMTVSYQAIRAARSNPVRNLRTE